MDQASVQRALRLRIVTPAALTISRRRCGRGFVYTDHRGRRVAERDTLQRIRSLAVPPAYEDVRIAASADAHLQAIGRDEAGRTQYRYHPGWDHVREARKVGHLADLAATLPRIRRTVARHLRLPARSRRKALAAVIALIDRTYIRIGCEDYVHSGRSRGAATLLKRNLSREGDKLRVSFRGKGGRACNCEISSPPLVAALEELSRLPGARLFKYQDASGKLRAVTAGEANAYLKEISGVEVRVKDFRTLAATAAAAERFAACPPAASATAMRRQIAEVAREVADMLGNTPTVARKSYIHRRLIDRFEDGTLARLFTGRRVRHLSHGEAAVARLFAAP